MEWRNPKMVAVLSLVEGMGVENMHKKIPNFPRFLVGVARQGGLKNERTLSYNHENGHNCR
jgi:hypothetical protein